MSLGRDPPPQGAFTLADLERAVRVPQATIQSYLQGLEAAGYLTSERQPNGSRNQERFGRKSYALVRDCGVDAPRVSRSGRPVTQGVGREAMWRANEVALLWGSRCWI
jgi:hypothetical protein